MADYDSDDTAECRDSDDNLYELEEEEPDDTEGTNDSSKQSFSVLKEADIKQCLEDDITTVSTVLSISTVDASILLRHYHWSLCDVYEAWFADEDGVRKTLGLMEGSVIQFPSATEITCGICFEVYPLDHILSAICGDPFCRTCWEAYINASIDGGPGCLTLRCPYPSCGAAVGQGMVNQLATDQAKEKYARYVLRSYVEESRTIKWCPAPGCEHAIKFVLGSPSYDVTCFCSHRFCWNCSEEAHRPVDCDTVSKWILKNSAESENLTWILMNAKSCPKCKRSIVKNQGCLHMTCPPPCTFEFCWLCLGAWYDHEISHTYACNRYDAKAMGELDEAEKSRDILKKSLKRYTHYYQRWFSNHMSRQMALVDLKKLQIMQREKLSDKQSVDNQLNIIVDAWLQIVECRRVLKWTYAYGFYLPLHGLKKTLFEYRQGEAESALEMLHHSAENNLKSYMQVDGPLTEFTDFGTRLAAFTRATKTYFENLVCDLENGLPEVENDNTGESEYNTGESDDNTDESDEEESILRRLERLNIH